MEVHLSGSLARFTNHNRQLNVEGKTVHEVLDKIVDEYPDLADILFDREERFKNHHRLYLNGESLGDALDEPVESDDRLDIMTAIAGG